MTPYDRLNDLIDEYDALRKHGAPTEEEYDRLMRRLQRHIAAEASKMRAQRYYVLDDQGRTVAGPLSEEDAGEMRRAGFSIEARLHWGP